MLTAKQIRLIRAMNTSFSAECIQRKAEEWEQLIQRIKNSGKDLSKIRIVPEENDERFLQQQQ